MEQYSTHHTGGWSSTPLTTQGDGAVFHGSALNVRETPGSTRIVIRGPAQKQKQFFFLRLVQTLKILLTCSCVPAFPFGSDLMHPPAVVVPGGEDLLNNLRILGRPHGRADVRGDPSPRLALVPAARVLQRPRVALTRRRLFTHQLCRRIQDFKTWSLSLIQADGPALHLGWRTTLGGTERRIGGSQCRKSSS